MPQGTLKKMLKLAVWWARNPQKQARKHKHRMQKPYRKRTREKQ